MWQVVDFLCRYTSFATQKYRPPRYNRNTIIKYRALSIINTTAVITIEVCSILDHGGEDNIFI